MPGARTSAEDGLVGPAAGPLAAVKPNPRFFVATPLSVFVFLSSDVKDISSSTSVESSSAQPAATGGKKKSGGFFSMKKK